MKSRSIFVLTTIAVMSVCAVGATIAASQDTQKIPLALLADEKTISLNSGNAPAQISSASEKESSEEVIIDSGNPYVTWDYYNVKKSDTGHIVLSIADGVWASTSTGYIQNHQPISGLQSLDVKFVGSGSVKIYGSNVENGEYVFLDVLEGGVGETDSTDRIVDYQYIKVANGSTENDVDLAQITFRYTCDQNNSLEKNDNLIKALGYSKNSGFVGSASSVTTAGSFSSQSLTWSSGNLFVTLGFDIPKAELENYKVVYYTNAADVTGFSSSHAYTRLKFKTCYEQNGAFTEGTSYYKYLSANIQKQSGWVKHEYSFYDMFDRDIATNMNLASGSVNAIRLSLDYTPTDGHFYVDQFHVERIGGSYVDNDIDIDSIEASDLTNGTLGGYGSASSEIDETNFSPMTSKQSIHITLKQGYPNLNFSALKADMTGKKLTFDVYSTKKNYEGTAVSSSDQIIVYKFSYGGVVADENNNNFYATRNIHLSESSNEYYTSTSLGNDWWRITIDFDAAAAVLTPTAGSWNMGIYPQGTFDEMYLDNMFLS